MGGIKLTKCSIIFIRNPGTSTSPHTEQTTSHYFPNMSHYGYFTSAAKAAESLGSRNTAKEQAFGDANNNDPNQLNKNDVHGPSNTMASENEIDNSKNEEELDFNQTNESNTNPVGSGKESESDFSTADESFSAHCDTEPEEMEEIVVEHIEWQHVWAIDPWDWKPSISPLKGTIPHPRDPRGQSKLPIHKRQDPRQTIRKLSRKKQPDIIPDKLIGPWASRDPRCQAAQPIPSPSMERMDRHQQMEVRKLDKTAPKDLMSSIMSAMEKLHCSTVPTYSRNSRQPRSSRVEIWPIKGPIPPTPRSPTRPKGSRNVPTKTVVQASNDPNSKRPRDPPVSKCQNLQRNGQ